MAHKTPTKGTAFLLKAHSGEEYPTYLTVAGLRVVHELIQGGDVLITAHGIMLGSSQENLVRQRALECSPGLYELVFETGEKLLGEFLITRFESCGVQNDEMYYSITLESAPRTGVKAESADKLLVDFYTSPAYKPHNKTNADTVKAAIQFTLDNLETNVGRSVR